MDKQRHEPMNHLSKFSSAKRFVNCALLVMLCCGANSAVLAQESGPQSFKIGESDVTPEVRLDYVRFTNVFRDGIVEEEADAFQVKPKVTWRADRRLLSLSAAYDGLYSGSDVELLQFADHTLRLSLAASPTKRLGLNSNFSVIQRSQTQQFDDIPEEGEDPSGRLENQSVQFVNSLRYGARDARGNIGFGLDLLKFVPGDNAEEFRFVRRELSHVQPFGEFSYRLSPDTRFTVGFRARFIDYTLDTIDDRSRYTGLLGFTFSETGVFGGSINVGYAQEVLDNDADFESDSVTTDLNLFYKPLSYSEFRLKIDYDFDDRTLSADNPNLRRDIVFNGRLDWSYEYSSSFSHNVLLLAESVTRDCIELDEVTTTAGIELNWNAQRWLEFGIGANGSSRTASACSGAAAEITDDIDRLEFEAVEFIAHVRATL